MSVAVLKALNKKIAKANFFEGDWGFPNKQKCLFGAPQTLLANIVMGLFCLFWLMRYFKDFLK